MTELHSIPSGHARAICEEVGDRLRHMLRADYADLPPRIRNLMQQLVELDGEAPSIAPSIDDMTRSLVPTS
jgi:hypothetical protein